MQSGWKNSRFAFLDANNVGSNLNTRFHRHSTRNQVGRGFENGHTSIRRAKLRAEWLRCVLHPTYICREPPTHSDECQVSKMFSLLYVESVEIVPGSLNSFWFTFAPHNDGTPRKPKGFEFRPEPYVQADAEAQAAECREVSRALKSGMLEATCTELYDSTL